MLEPTPNPVLFWLLRSSWEASILILLVGSLQWLFRKQVGPKWRHALWLLVVARLLLPISLPSPFSLYNFRQLKPTRVLQLPYLQAGAADPAPAAKNIQRMGKASDRPGLPGEVTPSMMMSLRHKAQDLPFLLVALWLVGAVALAARILTQDYRFARRVWRTQMVTDPVILQILEECRRKLQIRFPIPLLATAEIETPALYGALHPRLLIPETVLAHFSAGELRHIFLHELAHVKRRDMSIHWLTTLAQVVHWFNPLVWMAMGRMQVERELATDALALEHDESRETGSYGGTLIKLMESMVQPRLNPGVVGFLERKGPIKERIKMIAHFSSRKTSRWQMLAPVPLFLLGLVFLTDARTPPMEVSGRVGMWAAEGDAQDTAGDHHGKLKGDVAFARGMHGKAFDLNGQDQYIEIPSNPDLNPTGSFSISVWIFPRQDREQTIVSKWGVMPNDFNNRSYILHTVPDLGLRFCICDAKNQWNPYFQYFETQFQVLTLNAWNHVVAVYDQPAGTREIYVNGIIVAKRVDPPISIQKSEVAVSIGAAVYTPSSEVIRDPFDGRIDECSFYSRALTAAEAMVLYKEGGGEKH